MKITKTLMALVLAINLVSSFVLACDDGYDEVTVSCKITDQGTIGSWTDGSTARCHSEIVPGNPPKTIWVCTCPTKTYTRTCASSQGNTVQGCTAEAGGGQWCQGSTSACIATASGAPGPYNTKPDPATVVADCAKLITDCNPDACPATGGPENYCCPDGTGCVSAGKVPSPFYISATSVCGGVTGSTSTSGGTLTSGTISATSTTVLKSSTSTTTKKVITPKVIFQ